MKKPDGRTLYEILEVSPGASPSQIKRSFINLAKRYHPDKMAGKEGAEERFAAMTHAYKVLSDAAARYVYDLELGVRPGEAEDEVPPERRIEGPSVTGDSAVDYVEELTGGIKLPRVRETDRAAFEFRGFEDRAVRKAYEAGLYSIGALKNLTMHQHYELGIAALREKRFNAAVAYSSEAVRMNSRNMNYRFLLAAGYEAGGMLKEAAAEYEKTAELASEKGYACVPVREALISVYMKLGIYDRVKKQCGLILGKGLESTVAANALKIVKTMGENREEKGKSR